MLSLISDHSQIFVKKAHLEKKTLSHTSHNQSILLIFIKGKLGIFYLLLKFIKEKILQITRGKATSFYF